MVSCGWSDPPNAGHLGGLLLECSKGALAWMCTGGKGARELELSLAPLRGVRRSLHDSLRTR